MLKKVTAILGLVIASSIATNSKAGEVADKLSVYFDTDKASIKSGDALKLDVLILKILKNKLEVIVTGHADMRGARTYNLDLGKRRAQAVVDYLTSNGVKKDILSVSYGEEDSAAPNDLNKSHLALNRRAVIVTIQSNERVQTRTEHIFVPVKIEPKKNRLTILGGAGPTGLVKTQLSPNQWKVDHSFSPVAGVEYSRLFTERWSFSLAAFSNVSAFAGIGYSF